MGNSKTLRVSAPKLSNTRASRAALQSERNPAHKQDAGQREKRKKLLAVLESFHASIAGLPQTALSDMSSPESTTSKEPERHHFQPTASSVTSTPSLHHPFDLQDRGTATKSSTPVLSSEIDQTHATLFQTHPEQTTAMASSSLETLFSSKPHNDQSGHGVWDLGQAFNVGLEVEGINRPQDAEYHNTPQSSSSDLIREYTRDVSIHNHSQDSKTALHMAAENGKTSTVRVLLSLQPDILAQDAMGRTALHLAVHNQHEDVIRELLKSQTYLEVQDWVGQTALHVAATHGQERAVAYLIAAGADLECKDSRGQTAFHTAATNGWDRILPLLFKGGADINAKMKL